ncbi:MAG TPA: hypothetical protein VIK80_08750, partial [Flavihumibacter sp.]
MASNHLTAVSIFCFAALLNTSTSMAAPHFPDRFPADTTKKDSIRYTPFKGLPLKAERNIKLTTTEGTWMSVDLSPDGKTIVFDLLGDLYT